MKKRGNRKITKLRKVNKSKKRSGRRDRYHERPQECVAYWSTNGDQKRFIIKTEFE